MRLARVLVLLGPLALIAATPLAPAPVRAVPAVTESEPRPWPDPQILALSSGAPVRLLARPQVPLVRVEVSLPWDGGDASLTDQLAAAMMGQLLKAGTLHHSGAELDAALDRLGASWNIGATTSRLWGEVEVPVGAEAQALSLLREALLEPALDKAEAKRILDRWITWRESLDLDLVRTHDRAVNHAWYPADHRSRHTSTSRDLKRLRPRDVAGLHHRIVSQARPRIVVAGATTAPEILPLLEDAFGTLEGEAAPTALPTLTPRSTGWLVHRPGFEVARLTMLLPGPPLENPDAPLADLLMGILASEFTSRIPMDLRETRGLAYSVSGHAQSWRGDGRLRIDAEVDMNRAAEALVALDEHLDRLLSEGADGLSETEFRAAQNTLLVHHDRLFETVRASADTLGELLILDQELSHLRTARSRIATATPSDLASAASQWLRPAGRVWILTGDRGVMEPALERLERFPDRIVGATTVANEP